MAIVDSFIDYADVDAREKALLKAELKRYIATQFDKKKWIHPVITKFSTDWYREFYRLLDNQDPYVLLKKDSNIRAKNILPTVPIRSFKDAVALSIKGNQIDYGAVLVLRVDLSTLEEEFKHVPEMIFDIDDTAKLEAALQPGKTVLFLADNNGEIIFDIPLLHSIRENVGKANLFIVGKQSPMLNDVTVQDLHELGMEQYGHIVSTGSNCFGLHEEDVSQEFKALLKKTDVIIAKGQAYLEFFTEYDFPNVFNISYVKYPIVDEAIGVLYPHQKVVLSSERYCQKGKPYQFGILPVEQQKVCFVPSKNKIIPRSELKILAERLRKDGKKIVTINGSFDILHLGHVHMLEEAKRQGDVLIVGLNSDSSIHAYKSPYRPINHQQIRAEFIAAFGFVDYVFIFDETVPMPFLEEIKPDVHVNGSEYGEKCIEADTVVKNGGRVHIVNLIGGFSTTDTIKKVNETNKKAKEEILFVIERQKGVLFAEPALVSRVAYSGRNILAKNSSFETDADDRGYVPVEWWIMSLTTAENEKKRQCEGVTRILVNDKKPFLKDVLSYVDVLGSFKKNWPLTKILDIGGNPVKTSFGTEEVPPIPTHVHSGIVKEGKIRSPGKLEAYFFPPVNVPPYNADFGTVITRLGLKPDVSREQVKAALQTFGASDELYKYCNVYEINPYDGWTILPGTVHAPGPWITFEIQRPQDDFNLLGWQLGKRFSQNDISEKKQELLYRGLKDEDDVINQAIDWNISTNPHFKQSHYRPSQVIEQGHWGRRMQIFFDQFYGEAFEILPGQSYTRERDERPFAGIVWSGQGLINENPLDVMNKQQKEFLIVPNMRVTIQNTGTTSLLIYTVFPIKE